MCPAWRAVSSIIPISTRRNDTCSPNHAGAQVLQVLFVDHLIGGCASPAVEGDDVCRCLSGASAHVVDRVGFERLCFTSVGLTEPLVLPTPARCFTKPNRLVPDGVMGRRSCSSSSPSIFHRTTNAAAAAAPPPRPRFARA
jgi:hypothetical protein